MHDGSGTGNPLKIFANIFIAFVGAGVLGLPYAFKEAGILEGFLIMSFVGFVSVKAMLLLLDCKVELGKRPDVMKKFKIVSLEPGGPEKETLLKDNHSDTQANGSSMNGDVQMMDSMESQSAQSEIDYGDIGYYAIGDIGKLIVDISIVVSQTGFACAYLIFISNNMESIIPEITINNWVSGMMIPLILLCLLRQLHKLAIFSLFADFSNVLAYSVVFWFDFEHAQTVSERLHPKEYSLDGFPFFLGIAFYCYEGAGLICYLDSSVSPECRAKFRPMFKGVLFLVTALYMLFGICGYLSFGDYTESIITLNLPQGPMPLIVKACLCFSLFFTYPVAMFPVISTIERRLKIDPIKQYHFGNLIRLMMVLTTGIVVVAIPSFTTLMALVGATCCTLLAFILPGIFHLKIFGESITLAGKVLDYVLIILGIVATILGTIDALQRLFPEEPNNSILIQEG